MREENKFEKKTDNESIKWYTIKWFEVVRVTSVGSLIYNDIVT